MTGASAPFAKSAALAVGDTLGSSSLDLTLQRLIMVAGANRDFALAHSDNETARQGNAPAAFADSLFVFTMIEKLLLQWGGQNTRIRKLGPLKIQDFVVCGQNAIARGTIERLGTAPGPDGRDWTEAVARVEIIQDDGRIPVHGHATVLLPRD